MDKKDTQSEYNDGVTVSNTKPINKPVKWSQENELIMVEWCDIAQCYKWLHTKCHTKLARRHAWFTIPAIALSTISGTASFAQSSLPDYAQVYAPMVIGSINICIGISTTIQQYLKISELNEAHRISGISWDKFARNIRIELAKDPDERMDAGHFLKICRAELDRLMETSPSIDNSTVLEFKKSFQGSETADHRKQIEELQKTRFDELHKPDICNIIIPANESRHHWYKDVNRAHQNSLYDDSTNRDIYTNFLSKNSKINKLDDEKTISELERGDDVVDDKHSNSSSEHLRPETPLGGLQLDRSRLVSSVPDSPTRQVGILDQLQSRLDYITDFVIRYNNSVGRKPHNDEIIETLVDEIGIDTIHIFLQTYDSSD